MGEGVRTDEKCVTLALFVGSPDVVVGLNIPSLFISPEYASIVV